VTGTTGGSKQGYWHDADDESSANTGKREKEKLRRMVIIIMQVKCGCVKAMVRERKWYGM
jgi:hypothetical protein